MEKTAICIVLLSNVRSYCSVLRAVKFLRTSTYHLALPSLSGLREKLAQPCPEAPTSSQKLLEEAPRPTGVVKMCSSV